jgi:hypothetical protein
MEYQEDDMWWSSSAMWQRLHAWAKSRREDRLKEIVTSVIADCNDGERQAERLARWEQRMNQWSGR